jgi:hypothetical protein
VTSISHVVLVSWKGGKRIYAEESSGRPFEASSAQSPACSPGSRGDSTSREGLEDGYQCGFVVTFATRQARDAYLNDPYHRTWSPRRSAWPPSGS